jgi:hypothetical protein
LHTTHHSSHRILVKCRQLPPLERCDNEYGRLVVESLSCAVVRQMPGAVRRWSIMVAGLFRSTVIRLTHPLTKSLQTTKGATYRVSFSAVRYHNPLLLHLLRQWWTRPCRVLTGPVSRVPICHDGRHRIPYPLLNLPALLRNAVQPIANGSRALAIPHQGEFFVRTLRRLGFEPVGHIRRAFALRRRRHVGRVLDSVTAYAGEKPFYLFHQRIAD